MDQSFSLLHPLPGAIVTQTYAEHVAQHKPNYNGGLDLAIPGSPGNDPIICAAAGQVIRVGADLYGYGNFVKVRHTAELETLYAHMAGPCIIALYCKVSAGDILGYVGSSGNSTGPHLHLELRRNGVPIDPAPHLSQPSQPEPAAPGTPGVAQSKPAIPFFPALPKARIKSLSGLRVRDEPRGLFVSYIRTGKTVTVINAVETGAGEIWLQIGPDMWIAMWTHEDGLLAEWV